MATQTFNPNGAGNQLIIVGPVRPGVNSSFKLTVQNYDLVTKQATGPFDFTGWSLPEFHFGSDNPRKNSYQALIKVPCVFAPDPTTGEIQLTVTDRHMLFITPAGINQGYGGVSAVSPEGLRQVVTPAMWFMDEWSI